jgi:hypothetical protein
MAAGVPIIALPLQADQPANALLLAREAKVAVEMKIIDGVARRDEVESAVRSLMSGGGVEVKRRVKAVSKAAVSALSMREEPLGKTWNHSFNTRYRNEFHLFYFVPFLFFLVENYDKIYCIVVA